MNGFLILFGCVIYGPILFVWLMFRLIHDIIVGPSAAFHLSSPLAPFGGILEGRETEASIMFYLQKSTECRQSGIRDRHYRYALQNCFTSEQVLDVIRAEARQEYLLDKEASTDDPSYGHSSHFVSHPSRNGSNIVLWEDVDMFLNQGGLEANRLERNQRCNHLINN